MKQYRFGLCKHLDANLIEEIERRANGGSQNDAIRQYIRFLHETYQRQNITPSGQILPPVSQDTPAEINLSGLDNL